MALDPGAVASCRTEAVRLASERVRAVSERIRQLSSRRAELAADAARTSTLAQIEAAASRRGP